MSALRQSEFTPVSPEEYLAAERAATFKSEYYQGQVYAMAGASYAHNLVDLNTATVLNLALRARLHGTNKRYAATN
ncbi:hypothetical protein GCM10027422_20210 [Hymenobacter arcticus]